MNNRLKWFYYVWLIGSLLFLQACTAVSETTATNYLISAGAEWHYLDDGTQADPAWINLGFDDGGWGVGPAQLGYGDGDEATTISYGADPGNKYITTYFRHTFQVVDPASWDYLRLYLLRDDGAVVYLNGNEVYRNHMPTGVINSTSLATLSVNGDVEKVFTYTAVSPNLLQPGDNVLAVEIHQRSASSSDISFDLSLLGVSDAAISTVDWSLAGLPGAIPDVPVFNSVTDFGAVGDGVTNDTVAFQQAIAAAEGSGQAVQIPAGTYLITQTLAIGDSLVLRGAGAAVTHLHFAMEADGDGLEVVTYQRGDWIDVTAGADKDATTIDVADGSVFAPGDYFEIQQANDPAVMYTDPQWDQSWAQESVGEIGVVAAVTNNTLTLQDPLHISYQPSLTPTIRTQGFVENVGVERLHLKRIDTHEGNIISWKNSANNWLREVESESASKSHIAVISSYGCLIRDSYFHHAHDYGGGGHGYGAKLEYHTTNCLVENNVFQHLRHAMMVSLGANGNVFGYNYSRETFQDGGGSWSPPDISIHGHYSFYNLFEGNVVEEIGIGDFWGPAGPGNSYLRNCVQNEGLNLMDHSHNQNVIGNEFSSGINVINFVDPSVRDTILHGNYENGTLTWDPGLATQTIPDSYYLTAKPAFWGAGAWPATGGDMPGNCMIPARMRYDDGTFIPALPVPQATAVTIQRSNNDIQLNWSPVLLDINGAATTIMTYQVYRSSLPYFTPTLPSYMTTSDLQAQDMGIGNDYFYGVTAVNLAGESALSNRVGTFRFDVAPGALENIDSVAEFGLQCRMNTLGFCERY